MYGGAYLQQETSYVKGPNGKWEMVELYVGVSTHNWLSHEPVFLGEQQQGLMVKDLIDGHTK